MENIYIPITEPQRMLLQPIWDRLATLNTTGEKGAVMAQVYPDGMRVVIISGKEFDTIADTLGGDRKKTDSTLAEHMLKKLNGSK
jgi:hypothetical protein